MAVSHLTRDSGSISHAHSVDPIKMVEKNRVRPHPVSKTAFAQFSRLRFSALPPAHLLPPISAVKDGKDYLFFGGFQARIALSAHEEIPVVTFRNVPDAEIEMVSWAEVVRAGYGQLRHGAGFNDLVRAIEAMPPPLRDELLGPDMTRGRLADIYGRDRSAGRA